MIKPVMAQRTLSKVQIFGSNAEWRAALKKTIDPSQLPSNYGGTNNTHPFVSISKLICVLAAPELCLHFFCLFSVSSRARDGLAETGTALLRERLPNCYGFTWGEAL